MSRHPVAATLTAREGLRASLEAEHARLDREVRSLSERRYLGVQDQMERKRLQKLKLATRDRLEMLNNGR